MERRSRTPVCFPMVVIYQENTIHLFCRYNRKGGPLLTSTSRVTQTTHRASSMQAVRQYPRGEKFSVCTNGVRTIMSGYTPTRTCQ